MAYRYGNRYQFGLFPQSIEDYVAQADPVRVYDAFVESLEFKDLGIEIDPNQVGNSEYDPKAMLKLFVYGYSYGTKGSRKLERESHHNVSFMWLMGGLKPDHKTIAEFRRNNKEALKKVLKAMRPNVFEARFDRWQCVVCGRDQDTGECCTGPDI